MQSKTLDNKSKYLLMVEDTASVAALYRSYLTPLEIDINIVGTGRDAIESLNQSQFMGRNIVVNMAKERN